MHTNEDAHSTDPSTRSPRDVVVFFVATLVITYGLQAPALLARKGLIDAPFEQFMPLLGLSAFGPTLGAIVAARFVDGRGGVRALFARFSMKGVALPLIVLAPLVSGTIFLVARAIAGLFGASEAIPYWQLPLAPENWIGLVVFSLGEEIGWRGYAQPRLVERYGSAIASVVIGVVWALWHLLLNAMEGMPVDVNLAFLAFFVFGTFVFTWWTTLARGSIAVAFLFHVGAHLNNPHHAPETMLASIGIHTIAYAVVAVCIVAFAKRGWHARPAS